MHPDYLRQEHFPVAALAVAAVEPDPLVQADHVRPDEVNAAVVASDVDADAVLGAWGPTDQPASFDPDLTSFADDNPRSLTKPPAA
jgi:hypothetical protein